MKVNTVNLNSAYSPNMSRISFKNNQSTDSVKQTTGADVTQFKAVKANEVRPSFLSKLFNEVKSFFSPSSKGFYSPTTDTIDEYVAERVYLI